jgi:hypothetical protein
MKKKTEEKKSEDRSQESEDRRQKTEAKQVGIGSWITSPDLFLSDFSLLACMPGFNWYKRPAHGEFTF